MVRRVYDGGERLEAREMHDGERRTRKEKK